jgi:hypothetical protein
VIRRSRCAHTSGHALKEVVCARAMQPNRVLPKSQRTEPRKSPHLRELGGWTWESRAPKRWQACAFRAGRSDPSAVVLPKGGTRGSGPSRFSTGGWAEDGFRGKRWQCLVFDGIAWQDLCVTTLRRNHLRCRGRVPNRRWPGSAGKPREPSGAYQLLSRALHPVPQSQVHFQHVHERHAHGTA